MSARAAERRIVAEERLPLGQVAGSDDVAQLVGEELFLNTLIIGSKGSGKTTGVIVPAIEWMLGDPSRPGALVLDPKDDLLQHVIAAARRHGREDDVVEVHPRSGARVPLFSARLRHDALASIIVRSSVIESGGTTPHEGFWLQSAEQHLRYLAWILTDGGTIGRRVSPGELLRSCGDGADTQIRLAVIAGRVDDGDERACYEIGQMQAHAARWKAMDSRVRTSIEAEITRMLRNFADYEFARLFDPPADEAATEVTDVMNGKILVYTMSASEYGPMARVVAALLKSQFYLATIARLSSTTKVNRARPVFIVADEYHEYVTTGSGAVGTDEHFAAVCRQARAGMICATQDVASLYAAGGSAVAVDTLMSNFGNVVALRQNLSPVAESMYARRGVADLDCLARLQPYEAVVIGDRRPTPTLIRLRPSYAADWGWRAPGRDEDLRRVDVARRTTLATVMGDGRDGWRALVVGEPGAGKSAWLRRLRDRLEQAGVPVLLVHAPGRQQTSMAEALARECGFDRERMERGIILLDDIDVADHGEWRWAARAWLAPALGGERSRYGKLQDQVDMGKVTVVATATARCGQCRIGFRSRDDDDRQEVANWLTGRFVVVSFSDLPGMGVGLPQPSELEVAAGGAI